MLKILLPLMILSTPSFASPSLTAAASKWQNADETDAVLQVPVCRAFTAATTSKDPIEFSMAYPKEGKVLPMIGLRTKLAPPLVAIKISRTEREYLFLLKAGATNQDNSFYWYAPVNFNRLEELVRANNALDLVLDPKSATPTAVQVSLIGSTNALDMVTKCLKGAAKPVDFFKLLNAQKDNLTPDLGDRSPLFLMNTVQSAFDSFKAGQGINLEIAALRKANAPLLAKEASAKATLVSAQKTFDTSDAKLKAAQALVASLTTKLADSKAQLTALQTDKPLAETDLAAKKAIYVPLKAQMATYEKAIVDAAAKVKSIQASITANETLIERNTKRIPQLENESANLRRQIPGLESKVRSTQSDYDDADYKFRHYDVDREYRDEIGRDAQYGWAKSDFDRYEREWHQAQSESMQADSALRNAESALNSCRAQTNPQCSSQESEVNNARSKASQAQSAVWSASNSMNRAKDQMESRERDVKSKIQSESDRLRRIKNDAESDYDSARNALSNAQNRIAEIRNAIPELKAQITKAQNALPGLRDQLTAAQATLANAQQARDAFSQQIGFGKAEADFNAATKRLADDVAGISKLTKEIPVTTRDLATAQKTIDPLTKAFTAAQAALAKAQGVLAPIEEQLKPFHEQEGVKLAALEVESGKFKTARAAYQDLVKLLIQ